MELKLLKVQDIIKSQQLKLGYEFYNNMLPVDTQKLFILDSDIHEHQTRHSKYIFHIPEIQTVTYGNKSLKYYCPLLWNSTIKNGIPIDNNLNSNLSIDKIFNVHHFRRVLKKHFLFTYTIE